MKKISNKWFLKFAFKKEVVEEGVFAKWLDKVFAINKTEKQKILSLLEKADVKDLLFYTDVRNVNNILINGIKTVNDIKVTDEEIYYVWSFAQHDNSIDLEFDNSTRAHFWKWSKDIEFDTDLIAVFAINPQHLAEITRKDWLLDRAQNFVNISENIYPETFSWLMVQDIKFFKEAENVIKLNGLNMELYFGDQGIVRKSNLQNNTKDIFNSKTQDTNK
ncbi:hypothetical protein ESOMN_v1c05680 [Williamsoniiplasma somnilux]|uniref:Uncharacterized protein n=1 Tax=Williamsoniiplasma somnilux TaxID=215578 RepID=A0A2K8NYQ0_9MOLU|nr:hypothetical protein [Williamsoniiplasma somnilux]ATZ18950.1 hypothetical protein ESOMN_v1c05680 [Williamsoniiplasma somnilux]